MQFAQLKRREFIALVGGATAWPFAARAQERVRRIGMISGISDEVAMRERLAVFLPTLQRLGWIEGRNVQIEYRWGKGNAETLRRDAMELAALAPDVILSATGTTTVAPLLQATRTVPIVFVIVIDPVGAGFVSSLARPGGNATGFLLFEYGLAAKWLDLIKEIAPGVTRVGVLRDPAIASGIGQFGAIQSAVPSLRMEASPINVRDAGEIERDVADFARSANGGVIVTSAPETLRHRDQIITLAARH